MTARTSPLLLERWTRQALPDRRCTSVADAAAITVAVQAQDVPAARHDPPRPCRRPAVAHPTVRPPIRRKFALRWSQMGLTDDVLDRSAGSSGDDAQRELARRYFAAFSPAMSADFGCWAGLPHSHAVELVRDDLTPVEVDGRAGFRLGTVEPQRGVRLLPAFDNYLLGYADRAAILPTAMQPQVYQGGMIKPTVVADGAVVASWSLPGRAVGRPSPRSRR